MCMIESLVWFLFKASNDSTSALFSLFCLPRLSCSFGAKTNPHLVASLSELIRLHLNEQTFIALNSELIYHE